jgi:acyl-CoA synthetase (AMP-forming)/AMP-acid ligase II
MDLSRFCAGHLSVWISHKETGEMNKHREEFKLEAVRAALSSGLPRERVAADLGIGKADALWGETVHAIIHLRHIMCATEADLIAHCRRLIASSSTQEVFSQHVLLPHHTDLTCAHVN